MFGGNRLNMFWKVVKTVMWIQDLGCDLTPKAVLIQWINSYVYMCKCSFRRRPPDLPKPWWLEPHDGETVKAPAGPRRKKPEAAQGPKAKGGVHIICIINTDGPKGQAEKDSQARGRNKEQEWAKVTPSFKSPGKIPYDRRRQCRQSCTRVLTLSGTLEN